jgi:type IV pilus biogenesis protein CpaD/CtpE
LPVTLAGLLTGAAGCDRAHLTASHGRAYNQAFAAQAVNPGRAADARAVNGLDSQEAAIISSNYRRSLSPQDQTMADRPQLLMYSPRTGVHEANLPAPSVPSQR